MIPKVDRVPEAGRANWRKHTVKESSIPGQVPVGATFTTLMEMADNATVEGTPVNRASEIELLSASGTTTGTAGAMLLAQPNFTLFDGAPIRFKVHIAPAESFTLNVASTGAKAVVNAKNEQLGEGLVAGTWIPAVYSQTLDKWVASFSGVSENKAALVGAVQGAATATSKLDAFVTDIEGANTVIKNFMINRGVANVTQTGLVPIANRLVDVPHGFSRTSFRIVYSNGTEYFPAGAVLMSIAMVGAGSAATSLTAFGIGAGAGVQRVFDIDIRGLISSPVTIGQGTTGAGGATSFMGYTAPGASGTRPATGQANTGTELWGPSRLGGSIRVGGSGQSYSVWGVNTEVEAGGAYLISSSGNRVVTNMYLGGGGAGTTDPAGGNGRLEIIYYYE